jgi:hypothetical protein
LQAFFVLGTCVVSIPAAAQEAAEKGASKDDASTGTPAEEGVKPAADATHAAEPAPPAVLAPTETKPAEPSGWLQDWHTSVSGYFRAPMAMGISSRPGPDNLNGPSATQVSYGPNRTVDANYWAFTYTRLQEQDWAELFVHEKHKHVEAVLGMMGYWLQAAGFRNPDASWFPGMAYVALDTDIGSGSFKPNVALTMGAWWPKFGYFEKYDTYTLGRFRQLGEQLQVTLPVTPDITAVVTQGFGTNRDGSYSFVATGNPLYNAQIGLDLLTYENIQLTYGKYLDVGLHYNNEWTADPYLLNGAPGSGKSYTDASQAHLSVVGAEAHVRAPYAGHLWISPSLIGVKNGWALATGGTEVMHSLGGGGVAANYLGWYNTPVSSTGSGSILNLGFLYENSLSTVQGKPKGSLPEVTLSAFGLLANASLDLPANSTFPQKSLKEFKYGADVTVQALDWLAFVARYDVVNLDLDHPGYIYNVFSPRIVLSSHFLSGETVYLQYSRYTYGDNMTLGATWPWGAPLVTGNDVLQGGPYQGKKPDMDVIKLQATVSF